MTKPTSSPSALSRRTLISTVCAAAPAAILAVAAGSAAAQTPRKMAQRAVAYQATPRATPQGEQRCDNCTLFEAPNACRSVAGTVAPEGWCRIYVRARAAGAPTAS